MKKQCKFCILWFQTTSFDTGQCRRFPPTAIGSMESAFPQTRSGSWCGEFVEDKERVAEEAKREAAAKEVQERLAKEAAEAVPKADLSVTLDSEVGAIAQPPRPAPRPMTIEQAKRIAASRPPRV